MNVLSKPDQPVEPSPPPLKVAFIASEVEPFAKTGGLADVASALPRALAQRGHDVRVVLPRYGSIDHGKHRIRALEEIADFPVPIKGMIESASLENSLLASNGAEVGVYFVRNARYFGRDGLYVDGTTKKEFPDNDARFTFFSRAAIESIGRFGWQPDIVHCHDWQTGLVPAYLKSLYADNPLFARTRTVFTIHNMAYQGRFHERSFHLTGLPSRMFSPEGIEFLGDVNFLKAGIVYSDAITTVSEKYAEEICTSPEFGHGLEGLLRKRRGALIGILNGIDVDIWNPETDPLIPERYSRDRLEGKAINKKALQEQFGLTVSPETPLLGVISRLADQKGLDLYVPIIGSILEYDVQLVVLGTGEAKYHEFWQFVRDRYPHKVGVYLGFNNTLAHLIEAGSDIFLMPSRYEPCGLNQMYSLRYGSVPVVRATGGLDDTVEDFDPTTMTGTGFKFREYHPIEFLLAVRRAVETYRDRETWRTIMRNGMQKDFSWSASARKYEELYRKLLNT